MSVIIDGTNGISDVDGSASTPAIRGTDANTGIFFPAADTIAFAEGGTEAMRIDSSGNPLVETLTSLLLQMHILHLHQIGNMLLVILHLSTNNITVLMYGRQPPPVQQETLSLLPSVPVSPAVVIC